jgi:hypothetical protein
MRLPCAFCLPLWAAACQPAVDRDRPLDGVVLSAAEQDRDHDGLCDDTEDELHSNADRLDTDGDGFPDALELIAGTDLRDPLEPAADHVAHLDAGQRDLAFDVALTVDGEATAARGRFSSRNALDPLSRDASDFFTACSAVSAEPPESVRDVQPEKARFGTVLARARLRYRLLFSDPGDRASECVAALPFDFSADDELGHDLDRARYLLVFAATGTPQDPERFCRPVACL